MKFNLIRDNYDRILVTSIERRLAGKSVVIIYKASFEF